MSDNLQETIRESAKARVGKKSEIPKGVFASLHDS
jgi:hypothetical protein